MTMSFDRDSSARSSIATEVASSSTPARRRMSTVDRKRQILDRAIQYFAKHGMDGQLRNLTKGLGITHTLLYHYFPTKDALIKAVYADVFESRWKPEWEQLLDDKHLSPEEKFNAFYIDYSNTVLTYDFVRILIFSGLSDHSISDRFFELLRDRLLPRLIRETRKHCGRSSRSKPSQRELEFLMGLHGGIFYIGMRRWIYGQAIYDSGNPHTEQEIIQDRISSYLTSAKTLFNIGKK
ncbi:TetR/AcrR family transcriptional regulator [Polynucleobacter sp. AP-Elch-400A-B2]|jgi:AcrR family transcriptional regulator|uniref:TetR/AcrR family transcriptional regulator n=1 Tax=Polynucleobacter sp. AP-Elch-400A-B2 TaxID=2576930 RepID=UPI001BFEAF74|nr:TetR/AcrR family transcriptional regulator [Polynucleobacter sp. AP-Elch-400A-B2]QWE23951.1 TetR/AcrR family transcriptional regulator [Polynucleobacter sp. AP-Elch-400A-B2]